MKDVAGYRDMVSGLLSEGRFEELAGRLSSVHPADLAEVLRGLEDQDKVNLLKLLGTEKAADVLSEVDERSGQALLELLSDSDVVSLLKEMPSDDAADLLSHVPPEKSRKIELLLPHEDRKRLHELLEYDEESAGGIMEVEMITVREDATIGDAIDLVRRHSEEIENIQNIYVIDSRGKLLGSIELKDLLFHDPSAPVAEVMKKDILAVPADMDQEEVAGLFARYDVFALPVIDGSGVLVGRITVDDIIDVMEEEASEDITKLVGTYEAEIGERSPIRISRTRLPWLIGGILGQLINAVLISRYEVPLQTMAVLVFFIPLLIGTAGNIGSQAAVVVVRELALKEIDPRHSWRRVFREIQVALLNGMTLGGILFLFVMAWRQDLGLGILLWSSLLCVVLVAGLMGASVPLILHKLRVDPAIATGPFIQVSNDIIGLAIYLALATVYLSIVSKGV